MKMASKTHKDRVHEFNTKLEALSEHHDIPKASSLCPLFNCIYDIYSFRWVLDKKSITLWICQTRIVT